MTTGYRFGPISLLYAMTAASTSSGWASEAPIITPGVAAPLSSAVSERTIINTTEERINGLKWKSRRVEKKGQDYSAVLEGSYQQPGWDLIFEEQILNPRQADFHISIPVTDDSHRIELYAIGPEGQAERETLEVSPEDVSFDLSAGISFVAVSYREGVDLKYTEQALRPAFGFNYNFPGTRWSVGIDGYAVVIGLAKRNPEVNVSLIGFTESVGYRTSKALLGWELELRSGVRFDSMHVQDKAFGFGDLYGIHLAGVWHRTFRSGNLGRTELKVSPLADGLFPPSLTGATGTLSYSYIHPLKSGHSVSADWVLDTMTFTRNGTLSRLAAASLGFSYGF